jgi:hypothetical protein
MFWNNGGKNSEVAPYNKFNFLVRFSNLNSRLVGLGVDSFDERPLTYFAKKITAPSMKIDFERAYANEYVHYFQNGAIHWEPITVTFADFNISNSKDSVNNDINGNGEVTELEKKGSIAKKLSIRQFFNFYLQINLIQNFEPFDDINKSESPKNVTNVIDLPIFCNYITIKNNVNYANNDFSTMNKNSISTSTVEYQFYNPRVTNVDFGSFEYGSDDINEISVTFVPQWVVIK